MSLTFIYGWPLPLFDLQLCLTFLCCWHLSVFYSHQYLTFICIWPLSVIGLCLSLTFICIWPLTVCDLHLLLTLLYYNFICRLLSSVFDSSVFDRHLLLHYVCIRPSYVFDLHLSLTYICGWLSPVINLHLYLTFICLWPLSIFDLHLSLTFIFLCPPSTLLKAIQIACLLIYVFHNWDNALHVLWSMGSLLLIWLTFPSRMMWSTLTNFHEKLDYMLPVGCPLLMTGSMRTVI